MGDQAHPALPIKAAQLRLSNLAASQLPLPGASPADVERLSPTQLTTAKWSASRRGCLGQLIETKIRWNDFPLSPTISGALSYR